MGIYKNVSAVYKNDLETGRKVYAGLSVNGILYKGIRKVSEIKPTTPKKSVKKPGNISVTAKKASGK